MAYAVTVPDTLEMIVGEKLNLTIDFTGVMGVGDVATTPIVTMVNEGANESVPSSIIGTPYFLGNVLNTTISSTNLRPGSSYIASFTGSANNTLLSDGFETAGITQTLFRSFGTDATGTLNAWTPDLGAFTIAANQVTAPAGIDRSLVAGHPDWTDGTFQQRFQFATNATPRAIVHWTLQYQYLFVYADGTNLQWGQYINGAWAGWYGTASAVPLVNGTWYWFQVVCSGNTYTAKIFADAAGAINLSTQVGATSQATFTVNQAGKIGIGNSGAATCLFGGAFANVCTVTSLVPAGWIPVAEVGEVAFAWSNVGPFAGTYALSSSCPSTAPTTWTGYWAYNVSAVLNEKAWAFTAQAKVIGSGIANLRFIDNVDSGFVATGSSTSYATLSANRTENGTSVQVRLTLGNYTSGGNGTIYFDNVALYQGTPVTIQLKIDVVY